MPKSRTSRESSAASAATRDSASAASGSAHSSRSSTPTVSVKQTQSQPTEPSKHVQIETPDRTLNGTPPPAESRLRQRFKSVREELGKSMEDISVRIRNKGDGNYKVSAVGRGEATLTIGFSAGNTV